VALGHALLMESSPKQDEALKAPATQAVLRFDARIEKSVTRVRLVDGEGHKLQMPAMGEDKEGQEDRLTIPLPVLGAGAYQLQYTVLAADGHATPGILRFTIEAGVKPVGGPAAQPATKPATRPAAVLTPPVGGGIGK
jgi:methionine-rich copper-binding protein CopC